MNTQYPTITRRDALKTLGAGAALVGLGVLPGRASAATVETPQPFVLPALDYGYDALEPHIDAQTMHLHHDKHHQAYVTNANKALAEHPELSQLTAEAMLRDLSAVPESIRTAVRNNVGGHVNHSFFWKVIGPPAAGAAGPTGALASDIDKTFGSFDAFKAQFSEAATKRFGSGWAWLSVKQGALAIHSSANQDSPLSEGAVPVLGLDVWEHAYYLKYQNRRPEYEKAFWNVVNWQQAGANYAAATT